MKKSIVFAALLIIASPMWANSPFGESDAVEPASDKNPMSKVYKSYENAQGVSTVYISEEMFSLMSAIMSQADGGEMTNMLVGELEDENVDISKVLGFMDKLKGLNIMQTDNPKYAYCIKWSVERIVNDNNEYQKLMQVSDGGDRIVFYYITPDGEHVREFLMLQAEVDNNQQQPTQSCAVIQFIAEGLTIQDIAALAAEMIKDSE